MRHVGQLLGEFFNDVLNFDAKLLRTLKPLLFRPGFLSLEYFADRRMRYVSPLKLYFFLSVIAFFLIQTNLENTANSNKLIQLDGDSKSSGSEPNFTIGSFNGKPWNEKTNPVNETWIPKAGNDLINQRFARLTEVMRSKDWPKQLLHAAISATPQVLLVLLPFFALMLKFAYLWQRRLYMEHLTVALHNHAFLLLAISMLVFFNQIGSWLSTAPWVLAIGDTISSALAVWIPLYFLLSMKSIYRQSWFKTLLKFLILGFCYLFLISFGLVLNMLLGLMFL